MSITISSSFSNIALELDFIVKKVLDLIGNVTVEFNKNLDSILEKNRMLCDTCGADCETELDTYTETLKYEYININNTRGLKFKLEYMNNGYYIYTILLADSNKLHIEIEMFRLQYNNTEDLINNMKKFSESCFSENKTYESLTVRGNKCLKNWLKYYLNMSACKNCNEFFSSKDYINISDDKLCFDCNQKILIKSYECSICLATDNLDFIKLINCGHIFHKKCFLHKDIKLCPLCREKNIEWQHVRNSFIQQLQKEIYDKINE